MSIAIGQQHHVTSSVDFHSACELHSVNTGILEHVMMDWLNILYFGVFLNLFNFSLSDEVDLEDLLAALSAEEVPSKCLNIVLKGFSFKIYFAISIKT